VGAVERLRELGAGPEILGEPVPREKDGLRISPRNADLSPEERAAAPALFRALLAGQLLFGLGERKSGKILKVLRLALEMEPLLAVEALDVVDAGTLRPVEKVGGPAVLLAAAWAGRTLLADSVRLEPSS
jgi:pantoate--beta-alanine ligase